MVNDESYKEVYYHMYCDKCKHKDIDEEDDPCNECLTEGAVINSHKPTKFEEA